MGEDIEAFGARLRARREAAGLSQRELAERCGLSVRAVSNLECGRTQWPYRDTLHRLADSLELRGKVRAEFIAAAGRRHGPAGAGAAPAATDGEKRALGSVAGPGSGVVPRLLPTAVPAFAGRQSALAALSRMLNQPGGTAIITAIGGTAGVGKTALAVHWAYRVADQFPDGQLYADLQGWGPSADPVRPADVIDRFLDALGVPAEQVPTGADARQDLYRSLMAGRRMLVVLDNARDATQVRPLLPGGSACLVLVTSRSQLASLVAAEGAYPVSLGVLTVAEGRELLAVRLGADRVAAEPGPVGELVELCAGLPLALAITASRAALHPGMPIAALVSELRDAAGRLAVLDAGDGFSVAAVFTRSYENLPAQVRVMFRLLGIHPGPDISVAAAASLAGTSVEEARSMLAQLAEASLLTEHRPGRFRFHDLLRGYAAARAGAEDSPPAQRAAILRSLDHYLRSAYGADQKLRTALALLTPVPAQAGVTPEEFSDADQVMAWFRVEQHVLAALIDQAGSNGFDAYAWQLPMVLGGFYDRIGHTRGFLAIQQAALAAAERLGDPAAQVQVNGCIGCTYVRLGVLQEAEYHYGRAVALSADLGDHVTEAKSLLGLTSVCEQQGRYHDCLTYSLRTLALTQQGGDQVIHASALNNVGWSYALLGDYQQTLTYCQRAIIKYEEIGDTYDEGHAWDSVGYAQHHLGRDAEAISSYERSLALFRRVGDRFYEATILDHLGDSQQVTGRSQLALQSWQQAVRILDDLHHHDAERIRRKLQPPAPAPRSHKSRDFVQSP